MIDTITLRLKEDDFHILDHSTFSPDTSNLFKPPYARFGSRGYIEAYSNPTRNDYEQGIYKPSLTVRKRWTNNSPQVFLYIQFSAPKLIFGNNFDELSDNDYERVISELKDKLLLMSVVVNEESLLNAELVKIHFSKNIVLEDFVIPYLIIQELSKVDLNLRYDLSEKDYRNGGDSLRFHSNDFEIIFYDKRKDLEQSKVSEKRSIEKENLIQLHLFDNYTLAKHFEVLRIEVRYNSKRKLKQSFPLIETFKDAFSSELSTKILSKVWEDTLLSYRTLNISTEDKTIFFKTLMADNPKSRLNSILSAYTFIELSKDIGIRNFRKLIEKNYSRKTWYELRDKVNNLEISGNYPSYLNFVSQKLKKYEPTRLNQYQTTFKKLGNSLY